MVTIVVTFESVDMLQNVHILLFLLFSY